MIETKRLLLREFMEICCKSNKKPSVKVRRALILLRFSRSEVSS